MKRRIIKFIIFIFFLNLVQFSKLYGQIKIISPIKYNYTAFNGDKYSTLLYEGQYTNLIFTDTLIHDDTTCTKLSIMLDSVWSYYYQMSKTLPNTSSSYNKKGNVAFVSNTCGAGCAFIGTGSLEVGDANWINIFNNVKYENNGAVLKVAFYELGRNFYNSKIDDNLSVYPFWIPEPFANMGYLNAIDYLGLYMKEEYENELGYKFDLIDRANEFILDTNVKFISDVYTKDLYPNAYGNSGFRPFFNSGLLMKLCYEYGETFIKNFYKELYLLPKTNGDISEAYSNFCIASSRAVNINLKYFFIDGYKMNLNLNRVDESLASLPLLKLKVFANDKRAENYFKDSLTIYRIKAFGSKGAKDIKYKLYEGLINNESTLLTTSLNGVFYLPNKKFDYNFWVKIYDGIDSVISQQMKYIYRGNLFNDSSFEVNPNIYPNNISTSLEFYGKPYNSLLSATRDSAFKVSGKYSLRFNHDFFTSCGDLTNYDFPTVDFGVAYNEPFRGKYRVSAKIMINKKFESCPNIVYGNGIHFGIRRSNFFGLTELFNSESNSFKNYSVDYDTRTDTSKIMGSFFTIISYGIKGKGFVDDISIKAVLPPEQIKIISINSDTSFSSRLCVNKTDSLRICVDSAQDISTYQLLISKDSSFKTGVKNIVNTKNILFYNPADTGRFYLTVFGINEFGVGVNSTLKIIIIDYNPNVPSIKDTAYCNNASSDTLKATSLAGHTLNWYGTSATGGTASILGSKPTTTTVGSFSYYVSQKNNTTGCEGARAKIGVTINPLPIAPTVKDTSFCNNASVDSLKVSPNAGNVLLWYGTNATGGAATSAAIKPSTTNIGVNNYYLSQVNTSTGCEGPRAKIVVTIYAIPSAPTLSRDTASYLISNITKGNTWYKDGTVLTDTTQKIKPTTPGSYTAKTTQNGCVSAASNAYYYIVTDVINLSADEFIKLAPNPFTNQLNFDFVVKGYQRLNLEVFDMATGTKVASKQNQTPGIPIYLGQLSAGTYVIRVTSTDNKISYQFKMVKL